MTSRLYQNDFVSRQDWAARRAMLAARVDQFQLHCPKAEAVIGNGHLPTQTKNSL